MKKLKAATVTAALAVTVAGLPMVTAAPASAAGGYGKCLTATWYLNKNAVNLHNGCKKTVKIRIAERWWPDSSCKTIKPKKSLYYRGTGALQGLKKC
ncbi:hypothetical protein [Streptomyces sp. HNM0574]|uniref:hypothetical protein n=1 Tax=Streptomyces sp. HNM0574 TaxID=2714954 RepID=UPI00146DCDDA|nr:hypothetical protein [Streptomyces sp. HNM0574]NLU66235.1 hypothetical protein [Streptomyces sp. HNM0574]